MSEESDRIESTETPFDRAKLAGYLEVPDEDPVIDAYAAVCEEYGFGLFSGKVWIDEERIGARDGSDGAVRRKPAMGRDAFLDVAKRDERYGGMEFDVVCANDEFKKQTKSGVPKVTHVVDSPLMEDRGEIAGAYCIVYVTGRKPTYFFAPIDEYAKTDDDGKYIDFWKYVSAMIIKCAQSAALRLALGITGVVPADEARREDRGGAETEEPSETSEEFIRSLDLPEETRDALVATTRKANDESPNSWSLAKLKMRLAATGKDGADEVLAEISREIEHREEQRSAPAPAAS